MPLGTANGPPIADATNPAGRRQKASQAPRPKKPTVAQLASSFESVMAALPALTSQMAELNKRTKMMEDQMKRLPTDYRHLEDQLLLDHPSSLPAHPEPC